MRRLISLILCIAMLISSSTVVLADESTEEVYNTVSVEFSDSIGNIETLQIMVKNDNVYANAKELGERLGYDVAISEEYVSIYNQDADETVPYGLTVFYYDSTKVGHMLFTQMVDSYEAPFETIKNENGAWIPLEYSLNLTYGEENAAFSPFTAALRQELRADTERKLDAVSKRADADGCSDTGAT